MNQNKTKKIVLAGILCAVAVVGSMFSVPVFGSKCAPVQHMVNILCAVLLGPWYGVGVAFAASLIRNLLGLGSLMAFPGSMFGALLCGIMYHKTKNTWLTYLRNGDTRRTLCLSGCNLVYGQKCRRDRFLCLCDSVPDLYRRRCDFISNYY